MFRGYLRLRVAEIVGKKPGRQQMWWTAIITSLLFSLGHGYQGALGILLTGAMGMLFFLIVVSRRFDLTHAIIAHATVNAMAFVMIWVRG